jgi:hypothetical protein
MEALKKSAEWTIYIHAGTVHTYRSHHTVGVGVVILTWKHGSGFDRDLTQSRTIYRWQSICGKDLINYPLQ